jgi:diacylglycerol O-acyltransferase
MHRLHGADALFLYGETPTQHMHTLKIGIFDPGPAGYSFAHEREKLRARLHRVPPFRWRVVPTPFALHHPIFLESEVDLDYHVRRIAAPSPGGPRELAEIVGEIASLPLDRSKPLWEMWIVEGLAAGRIAAVCKIHHTLADGVASAELLNEFLTHDPDEELPHDAPALRAERTPAARERVSSGLRELARFLPRAVRELARAARATRRREREEHACRDDAHLRPFATPSTPLNGILSTQRRFAFCALPAGEARAAREALGLSVTELVLALVAGALRASLLRRGALPSARLVASVPVSLRTEADRGRYGNHTGAMRVELATDVEDSLERVRETRLAAQRAKRKFREAAGAHLADWLELFPPFLSRTIFSRLPTRMLRSGRPPQSNVIVSSVPGARSQLYYGETPLPEFYSVGPLLEGIGLNVTVWSYGDTLAVSVLADSGLVRDAWEIVADLRAAFEELTKTAAALAPSGPGSAEVPCPTAITNGSRR